MGRMSWVYDEVGADETSVDEVNMSEVDTDEVESEDGEDKANGKNILVSRTPTRQSGFRQQPSFQLDEDLDVAIISPR